MAKGAADFPFIVRTHVAIKLLVCVGGAVTVAVSMFLALSTIESGFGFRFQRFLTDCTLVLDWRLRGLFFRFFLSRHFWLGFREAFGLFYHLNNNISIEIIYHFYAFRI